MAEQSIGFPQLILIFLLGGITIRYFFFSSSLSTNRTSNHAGDLSAREADAERIQQMFPQVSRRSVLWDLQRNGGNVSATIERILSVRGLEDPPQSFQPLLSGLPSQTTSETSSHSRSLPAQPDLITRYDLRKKIMEDKHRDDETGSPMEQESLDKMPQSGQAWSSSKLERQVLLQKRREEMILAARRKMEAKIAAEKSKSGA